MIRVTFTEFRKDASSLFSAVENGEKIQVLRDLAINNLPKTPMLFVAV